MGTALIALGGLLLVALGVAIVMYGGFVRRRGAVQAAFAAIDVQLKKRWDLVPDLIETVKADVTGTEEIFETAIRARRGVELAETGTRERFGYEQDLGATVSQMLGLAESHPELAAKEHFQHLQRSLTEIETRLGNARRAFNAAVTQWNEGVERFPGRVMAKALGFQVADWFETPTDQRKASDVRL